jgi:hypothetical protein
MLIRRKPFLYPRRKRRRGPERSPAYLTWIRTLGCVVCGRGAREFTRIDAAHTTVLGPRGLGQKSSDFSAIPLCSWDHLAGPDSYHRLGEQRFAERHGINLQKLVSDLNESYRNSTNHE